MNEIYHRMKEEKFPLDNEEYGFNLKRVGELLAEDAPTAEDLEGLPQGCVDYFVQYGRLNARHALRRMRQQAARSERQANRSPGYVGAALLAAGGYVSTKGHLCEQWDFRREEEPPWKIMSELGTTDGERERHLTAMRRIAREAGEPRNGTKGKPSFTQHEQEEEFE